MERPAHFPELFIGSVYNGHQRWHGDHGRFISKDLAMEMIGFYLGQPVPNQQQKLTFETDPAPAIPEMPATETAPKPERFTIFDRIEAATQEIREKYLGKRLGGTATAQLVDLCEQRRRRRSTGPDDPTDITPAVGAEWMPPSLFVIGSRLNTPSEGSVLSHPSFLRMTAGGDEGTAVRATAREDNGTRTVIVPPGPPYPVRTPTASDIPPVQTYEGDADGNVRRVVPKRRRGSGVRADDLVGEGNPPVTPSGEPHERRRRKRGWAAFIAAGALAVGGLIWWGNSRHDPDDNGRASEISAPTREPTPQGPPAPASTEAPDPGVTVPAVIEEVGDEAEDIVDEAADDIEDVIDGDDQDEEPASEPYEAPQPEPREEFLEREPAPEPTPIPYTVPPPETDYVPPEETPPAPAADPVPGPIAEVTPPLAPAVRVSPPPAAEVVLPPAPEPAPEPAPAPDTVIPTLDRPTEVGNPTYVNLDYWPLKNARLLQIPIEDRYAYVQFALDVYNWTQHRHFVWDHTNGMFWENGRVINRKELRVYNNGMADILELGLTPPER